MEKEVIIKQNVSRVITLNKNDNVDCVIVSLIDDNAAPIAKYAFDRKKIHNAETLVCTSYNYKVQFNITPSYSSEILPHLYEK